jgi:hypothetical protein
MKEISEKLDKIDARLDNMEILQVKHTAELEYHIKRTDELQTMLEPIYRNRLQLIGIAKFLGAVAFLAGLAKTFFVLFE